MTFASFARLVPLSGPAVLLLSAVVVRAATHNVDSLSALQTQLKAAAAGDTIVVKDGTYTTTSPLTVRCTGTLEQPITITAETVGGVEISGNNGFNVIAPAEHVIIRGFKFTHAAGKTSVGLDTRHARFTRNVFACTGDGAYISILGDDVQIDYNEFADKKTAGSMLAIGGIGSQVARRVWVHHNFFHDLTNLSGTTSEMIRFGLSALALSNGAGVVEHNLFVRCRGENELISNRASGITYRFNTFADSPTARITLRHGNDCVFYGNVVRNTEGIRIFGDRHLLHSNYLEGNYIGINIGNGSTEVADGGVLTGHDRPDDCVIAFNTLVDNRTHYQLSRRNPEGLGARRTTFANNIVAGRGLGAKLEGPYNDPVWGGNVLWVDGGAGDFPNDSYTRADPLLAPGPDGLKRPQAGSPAIDSAVGEFNTVTVDLDGQPRGEKKDQGADELSDAPVTARVLTPEDVGPAAKAP